MRQAQIEKTVQSNQGTVSTMQTRQKVADKETFNELISKLEDIRNEAHCKVFKLQTIINLCWATVESESISKKVDLSELAGIMEPFIEGIDKDLQDLDEMLVTARRERDRKIDSFG